MVLWNELSREEPPAATPAAVKRVGLTPAGLGKFAVVDALSEFSSLRRVVPGRQRHRRHVRIAVRGLEKNRRHGSGGLAHLIRLEVIQGIRVRVVDLERVQHVRGEGQAGHAHRAE
jgi:hypothetical protein